MKREIQHVRAIVMGSHVTTGEDNHISRGLMDLEDGGASFNTFVLMRIVRALRWARVVGKPANFLPTSGGGLSGSNTSHLAPDQTYLHLQLSPQVG